MKKIVILFAVVAALIAVTAGSVLAAGPTGQAGKSHKPDKGGGKGK